MIWWFDLCCPGSFAPAAGIGPGLRWWSLTALFAIGIACKAPSALSALPCLLLLLPEVLPLVADLILAGGMHGPSTWRLSTATHRTLTAPAYA